MTADAALVLSTLFGSIWRLFTSWYIPGTRTTPAAFAVLILFVVAVLRFIKSVFDSRNSDSGKG